MIFKKRELLKYMYVAFAGLFFMQSNGMESMKLRETDSIPMYFYPEDFNPAIDGVQVPEPAVGVGVNQGKSITIASHDKAQYTFYTDSLLGCVATIIDIEHHNNDHTIAMCHFAHYAKNDNVKYLKEFLNPLELENKSRTIKSASCIICPPGIHAASWLPFIESKQVIPTFDENWKKAIISTVKEKLPSITIEIKPYLMNRRCSTVRYFFEQEKHAKTEIINRSLVTHPQVAKLLNDCQQYKMNLMNIKPLIIPTISAFLLGSYLYLKRKIE